MKKYEREIKKKKKGNIYYRGKFMLKLAKVIFFKALCCCVSNVVFRKVGKLSKCTLMSFCFCRKGIALAWAYCKSPLAGTFFF